MVRNLTRVTETRNAAVNEARAINKNLRSRGIKREAIVKQVGASTLKRLMRADAFRKLKKKKQYGVFMRNR